MVAAGGVNRTEAERGGEAVATVQQVPLIALNDLGSAVGKLRLLCEGLWGRAFLTAYNSANDEECLRMAEGLGAGLALLAVPMVEAFTFTQAQFQRILSNFVGLEGAISVPHTHHCGGGVTRVLMQGTANHLQVCPVLERNSAPHDAVRAVLSHLVVQKFRIVSPTLLWWKPDSQLQTEVPSMRMRSSLIPPPGEGHLRSINRHNRVRHFTGTRRASWAGWVQRSAASA